ncbi:MAG: Ig-like domain-containing protein [Terracidiphilus sp.]|nr:Ig-like domain-containing protein [Terracidiphilus sp.]
MCLLATLLVVIMAGCGQETVTLPGVVSVTPVQGATSVAINTNVTATFNMAMKSSSITAAGTFTLAGPGGTAVAGVVTYSGMTATFTPSAALAYGTTYTATITTAAATPGGAELISPYVWSFTTVALAAPTPVVVTTIPANGDTNVPISQVLSATFSQTMSASTISTTTFTLSVTGGAAVSGTVTPSGTYATFTPNAPLLNNTSYTATITTGATSQAGISLATNYVWTFTTITATPTVTAVSPLNGATAVPIAQVLSATFSEAMNTATLNAATFTVTGPGGVTVAGAVVPSSTGVTFTPTVNLAYSSSYVATITTGAEDLAGTGLATNYVWTFTTLSPALAVVSTLPLNTATGVPVDQTISGTFNEPMTCPLTAGAFTVTGPGSTAVAGTIGCSGSTVTFTPSSNLAFNTLFTATFTTATKDTAGTFLSSNYVWTFLTVAAPTAPTVISTVPVNQATSVPINQALTATFSEAMDPATINSATFTLTVTGGATVNGVITYVPAGSTATFTPFSSLAYKTNYTATITTGAMDLNDNAAVVLYSWTFTTAAAPVPIIPTVISTIPVTTPEDTNVPLNQVISAVFSEAMNPATISSTTFTLTSPGTPAVVVPGLVAYSSVSKSLVFIPTAALTASTVYTATITTGAQDLAGDALASNYVWIFQTGTGLLTTPPELVSEVPASAAINVPINQAVSATFSEAMNPLTLTNATFQLYAGSTASGTPIAGAITYDSANFIATFTPTNPLTVSSLYTATVTDGATDLAGNPLGTTGNLSGSPANTWTFETGTTTDTAPVLGPTITPFGGFAGSAGMTNTGTLTVIHGDSGTTATGFSSYTGFHDDTVLTAGVPQCVYTETGSNVGLVTGTIYSPLVVPAPYACPLEGTSATTAVADEALAEAFTAYTTLQGLPSIGVLAAELGNTTIPPGVYKNSSSVGITTGPVTLDAKGDPNAYWVFQIGSTLTVGTAATPASVILINGALAKNVFWAVGSDVPHLNQGGGGTFDGTVIAYGAAGIAVSTVGNSTITTINGRLIGLNASVTLVNTVINVPAQ